MSDTYVLNSAGEYTIVKDPNAILDYTFDWSDYLADIEDVIVSYEIFVIAPVVLMSQAATDTTVTVWLSGGTLNDSSLVTCRIVTVLGRTDDRSFRLLLRDR